MDLLHDLILIAQLPACALWARSRWGIPAVVNLARTLRDSEPAVEVLKPEVVKTVRSTGGIRWPGGIVFYKPLSEA